VIVCHAFRVRAAATPGPDAPNSGRSRFRNPWSNIVGLSANILGDRCVNFRGEKMAGQAGWYRAPGEDGILRYWNGSAWTDHRQPAQATAETEPAHVRAEEPDPMAEYERQFASPSPDLDRPSFDLDQRHFETSTVVSDIPAPSAPVAQPQYRPLAALAPAPAPAVEPQFAGAPTSTPRSFAPEPSSPVVPSSLGPIALGPAATPAALTEFEQVLSESSAIAIAPKAPAHREPLAIEAPTAPAPAVAGNRKAVVSSVRSMGIAILVILLGIGAMAFFSAQNLAGPGEAKTIGIVTSFGSTTGNSCSPIARFAVKGKSYTASSNTSISPCPVGLGQDVDVIYSAADPASAAHIQLGSSFAQYLWLVPLGGVLFFLASLTAFVVRAGGMLAGIALMRDGGKRSKKAALVK
jgi:hypothetical protein